MVAANFQPTHFQDDCIFLLHTSLLCLAKFMIPNVQLSGFYIRFPTWPVAYAGASVCGRQLLEGRLHNDLYCVEWDVKLYYTIPYQLLEVQMNIIFVYIELLFCVIPNGFPNSTLNLSLWKETCLP